MLNLTATKNLSEDIEKAIRQAAIVDMQVDTINFVQAKKTTEILRLLNLAANLSAELEISLGG